MLNKISETALVSPGKLLKLTIKQYITKYVEVTLTNTIILKQTYKIKKCGPRLGTRLWQGITGVLRLNIYFDITSGEAKNDHKPYPKILFFGVE